MGNTASYLGPLAAVFGSALSFAGATWVKFHLDTRRDERSRDVAAKALADAMRGELLSIRAQLKQYRSMADGFVKADRLQTAEPTDSSWVDLMRQDLKQFKMVKTPVYAANVAELGLVWNRLAREAGEFYGRLEALKHFSVRAIHAPDHKMQYRILLFADECHALIWEATHLAERLLVFSMGMRYPKKRLRTKNALVERVPEMQDRDRSQPPPIETPDPNADRPPWWAT